MCGIAGFVNLEAPAERQLIGAMLDDIRHRGPDDEGFHLDGPAAIGMRRLSIIDLNTGHQPICNEDGTVWIVFNGEIYNYQELRDRLIAQGHQFRTASDTETLVHLYEQEGAEGLRRLRGMFAYAIWDSRARAACFWRATASARSRSTTPSCRRASFSPASFPACVPPECRWNPMPMRCACTSSSTTFPTRTPPTARSANCPPAGWMTWEKGAVRQGCYWELPVPAVERRSRGVRMPRP